MASYAPLFVNANDRKWNPDAIVFNANKVYGTPSYWVQYLFRESSNGAAFLQSHLQTTDPTSLAASAILCKNPQNNKTTLKIKVANMGNDQVNLKISVMGFAPSSNLTESTVTVLTSINALDENTFSDPRKVVPKRSPFQRAGKEMNVTIPPISLTVFDLL
ncbi:hypothetical protein PIB30_100401 [Stylosanthes scabra]|uniref:Alpha-L-arabinofuranosidase C-terminal domain-containing protein n=1 Tax=Stylosanthes scabra TaxID=79078 RepID=A0ABU6ZWF6_9FABA|nr:hypothetical protein [Stylosanthes scabra]